MLISPFPEISCRRLILRQTSPEDKEQILFLRSNEKVNRFVKRKLAKNVDDALDFIHHVTRGLHQGISINWSIFYRPDNQMIGTICLWNYSPEKQIAEVGYDLHPEYQGKGLMSEALTEVLKLGFNRLRLKSIEAYTQYNNRASIALLHRHGFVPDPNQTDPDNPDNRVYRIYPNALTGLNS